MTSQTLAPSPLSLSPVPSPLRLSPVPGPTQAATWASPTAPPAVALRPTSGLTLALLVVVAVRLVLSVAAQAMSPTTVVVGQSSVHLFEGGLGAFAQLANLATIIIGLVWVHRVASNARILAANMPSPGWAMGCWFIPLANAILGPMNLSKVSAGSGAGRTGPVVAWWAAFALHTALALVIFVMSFQFGFEQSRGLAPNEVKSVPLPSSILSVGWVDEAVYQVSGILFALVAWNLSKAQEATRGHGVVSPST